MPSRQKICTNRDIIDIFCITHLQILVDPTESILQWTQYKVFYSEQARKQNWHKDRSGIPHIS